MERKFSRTIYRIEPKPEGGFVARCDDPVVPAIEGATKEEVQQQIMARLKETLGERVGQLEKTLHVPGVNVNVKTEWKVQVRDSTGRVRLDTSRAPAASSGEVQTSVSSSSGPIQKEPPQFGPTVVKAIIFLVAVLLLLLWMGLHH